MRKSLLALLLVACGGCQSIKLPPVAAGKIHQTISFYGVTSTVDASEVRLTATQLTAKDASWRLTIFGYTAVTQIDDFVQVLTPKTVAVRVDQLPPLTDTKPAVKWITGTDDEQ